MFNVDMGVLTRGVLALERMAIALERLAQDADDLISKEDT